MSVPPEHKLTAPLHYWTTDRVFAYWQRVFQIKNIKDLRKRFGKHQIIDIFGPFLRFNIKLSGRILPFWNRTMDLRHDSFFF